MRFEKLCPDWEEFWVQISLNSGKIDLGILGVRMVAMDGESARGEEQ